MTVEERLQKLEKELSRVNRRNRRLLAAVVVFLAIGVVCWIFGPQVVLAQLLAQNAANSLREILRKSFRPRGCERQVTWRTVDVQQRATNRSV